MNFKQGLIILDLFREYRSIDTQLIATKTGKDIRTAQRYIKEFKKYIPVDEQIIDINKSIYSLHEGFVL